MNGRGSELLEVAKTNLFRQRLCWENARMRSTNCI